MTTDVKRLMPLAELRNRNNITDQTTFVAPRADANGRLVTAWSEGDAASVGCGFQYGVAGVGGRLGEGGEQGEVHAADEFGVTVCEAVEGTVA